MARKSTHTLSHSSIPSPVSLPMPIDSQFIYAQAILTSGNFLAHKFIFLIVLGWDCMWALRWQYAQPIRSDKIQKKLQNNDEMPVPP
jgi:hypothetical protein